MAAVDIGVSVAAGSRRTVKTQVQRRRKAARRACKVAYLRKFNNKASKLAKVGPIAQLRRGQTVMGHRPAPCSPS